MTSTDNKSARRQWLLAAGGVALTSAVGIGVWQAVRPAAGELDAGLAHFWVPLVNNVQPVDKRR